MILYYSPGACSLVPHIALEEAGAKFQPVRIALAQGEHRTNEYLRINPHARVPALGTDRGVITENVAILNFLAMMHGAEGAVPLHNPFEAGRCNELLGWFASSVHIAFAQIWRPERFTTDATAQSVIQEEGHMIAAAYFSEIESLCGDSWISGASFTAADSYLLTFFRWGRRIDADMAAYPSWRALVERALQRPAVVRALRRENLDPSEFELPAVAMSSA